MPPKKNEPQDLSQSLEAPELEQADNQEGLPENLMYGNKDADKSRAFPKDWGKQVVVYQCQIQQLNGGVVELPNTHMLQTYQPDVFDRMNNSDGKQPTSFFSESKMKVVVLHDPRG